MILLGAMLLTVLWAVRTVPLDDETLEATNPRRRKEESEAEGHTGDVAVGEPAAITPLPVEAPTAVSPVDEGLPVEVLERDPGPNIPPVLGYPGLLRDMYQALASDPRLEWDPHMSPIDILAFDTASKFHELCGTLPVIETPVFAMVNAAQTYPEQLRVLGTSFYAGAGDHRPFQFVARPYEPGEEKRLITADDLRGKAISVLGKLMSPTALLCEALKAEGIEVEVWPLTEWKRRRPSEDRVDLQVDGSLEGQIHALEAREVDLALLIFPYNQGPPPRLRGVDEPVCKVAVKPLEDLMWDFLASRPLNALVTNAAWYESSDRWRDSVDHLVEVVEEKNRFLSNQEVPNLRDTLAREEIRFATGDLRHADEESLRKIAEIGTEIGLIKPGVPKGEIAWVSK